MPSALITGGCGFIGAHTCERFLDSGWDVTAVDDLSRDGSEENLEQLEKLDNFSFHKVDISRFEPLRRVVQESSPDVVIHLAAQVAVTTSVAEPRRDFEINALGTLNVLESLRTSDLSPLVIYASTNKVYGSLKDVAVSETASRYEWPTLTNGVSEAQPVDFYSPYGCSKGAADQYCRDYWRIYGIPTVTLRQSCIYGPRQSGKEDQGWVAWFAIAAISNADITIFGDGKQVRDLLYVDDLTELYLLCAQNPEAVAGKVFNVGGGSKNTLSLLEYLQLLASDGLVTDPLFDSPRPGDQLIFISDNSLLHEVVGWRPKTALPDGIEAMLESLRLRQPEN